MSPSARFSPLGWIALAGCAVAILLWIDLGRARRIEQISALPPWSVEPPLPDPQSPTGYAGGVRKLILVDHNNDSYQWIAQAQQMVAESRWRIRHVDSDNAPLGRPSRLPSVYAWWVASVGWLHHAVSGQPVARSIEDAACLADPVLHLLAALATAALVARFLGWRAAVLVLVSSLGWFPFVASSLPGTPDRTILIHWLAAWSVLFPVLAIARGPAPAAPDRRGFFTLGAIAGACGLWVGPEVQVPVLLAIVAAGALLPRLRPAPDAPRPPWRWWGLVGCATSLAAYLLEYFPGDIGFQFETNHPVFAVGWLGAAELAQQWADRAASPGRPWRAPRIAAVVLGTSGVLLPVFSLWMADTAGPLASSASATRLTTLGGGVAASSAWAWLVRDGTSALMIASWMPFLLAGAGAALAWKPAGPAQRSALILVGGPVLAAALLASAQLRWVGVLQALCLPLLAVAAAEAIAATRRLAFGALLAAALLPSVLGWMQMKPAAAGEELTLAEPEVQGLIERDLAHWLTRRTGERPPTVLAPPEMTAALSFYGPVRGIGTLFPENHDGLSAAVRISSATSFEEGRQLVENRGITHIVMPSWDTFLDEYAEMGSRLARSSLVVALHRWALPPWVRPTPYLLPKITGLETQSVTVFEIVPVQNEALLNGRLAEYLIDTGNLELASRLEPTLRKYPGDLRVLPALIQLQYAAGDAAGVQATVGTAVKLVQSGADRMLPWDRRLSLALALVQGRQIELAEKQARRCAADASDARIRSVSAGTLFRLLVLCRAKGIEWTDPKLRDTAIDLLPPELRAQLQQH